MKRTKSRAPWLRILGIVVLFEVFAVALTLAFGAIFHLPPGETIDLGQLIVALLLLPPAIAAFWQTAQSLREASARPSLYLAFLGMDGLLHETDTMNLPLSGGSANRVTLAVENRGDAIAVWWQAHFDIPVEMMRSLRAAGCSVNVMPRHVSGMTMDTVGDVERRVVQSAGTIGLFPGPPVQIASVEVHVDRELAAPLARDFGIAYELITDKSRRVTGTLPLKISLKAPS